MSSFGCPHYDWDREHCIRLHKDCVPGRPGCVLCKNSVFLFPVEERLGQRGDDRDEEEQGDAADQE